MVFALALIMCLAGNALKCFRGNKWSDRKRISITNELFVFDCIG